MSKSNSVERGKVALHSRLAEVNGKRRERLLDYADIIQAIREALNDDDCWGYVTAGGVANSYKYVTWSTSACAVAVRQAVIVRIRRQKCSGHHVNTGAPWRRDAKPNVIQELAKKWAESPFADDIVLSRLTARKIVLEFDRANAEKIEIDPKLFSVRVTAADSIRAGNCQRWTARVAKWFSGDSVDGETLIAKINALAPHLLRFAIRALEHASKASV